jgi:leucyl-tRNA synthetase
LKDRGFVFEGVQAEPVRRAPLGPYSLDSKEDYKFADMFERLNQKYKNDDRKKYGICSKYGVPDLLFNKDSDKGRFVDKNGNLAEQEEPVHETSRGTARKLDYSKEDWTKGYKELVERIRKCTFPSPLVLKEIPIFDLQVL